MKIKNDNQHQKNLIGGCPKQSTIWEFLTFDFKKMITEVLLVLPYLILFFIWWRFRHLIKIMTDVGDILNDNEFFGDIIDTPKEGIEQHKKRQGHIWHKWTHERVDKASDETINKTYAEHRQRELNEKGEKTGEALDKHAINLYSTGIS